MFWFFRSATRALLFAMLLPGVERMLLSRRGRFGLLTYAGSCNSALKGEFSRSKSLISVESEGVFVGDEGFETRLSCFEAPAPRRTGDFARGMWVLGIRRAKALLSFCVLSSSLMTAMSFGCMAPVKR